MRENKEETDKNGSTINKKQKRKVKNVKVKNVKVKNVKTKTKRRIRFMKLRREFRSGLTAAMALCLLQHAEAQRQESTKESAKAESANTEGGTSEERAASRLR